MKPRVISPNTGEIVLLEDVALLHLQGLRSLEIVGGPGSGKTTALAHLAALPEAEEFVFADNVHSNSIPSVPPGKTLIYATRKTIGKRPLNLASWSNDDLIEYLLARAPDRCASVMDRFRTENAGTLNGNPQLMCIVADELTQESGTTFDEALHKGIEQRVPNEQVDRQACLYAMASLLGPDQMTLAIRISDLRARPELMRLLSHRAVQIHFASKHLASLLMHGTHLPDTLLPRELIVQTANSVQNVPTAIRQLHKHFSNRHKKNVAMAASMLHCLNVDWTPHSTTNLNLSGGHFARADWEDQDLRRVNLSKANLSNSNLTRVDLRRANLHRTDFAGCNLEYANLNAATAEGANFSNANLEHAYLDGGEFNDSSFVSADLSQVSANRASFRNADFTSATLRCANLKEATFARAMFAGVDLRWSKLLRADLTGSDFQAAQLDGANLRQAALNQSNFENVSVREADLSEASMSDALLTGSEMICVRLNGTKLMGCGLADVDWQDCDLRRADFNNCSFHLGSTRCGLVGDSYPSHGTRTGFYTDDFDSHIYRTPEEVRKASLQNCDLRDADVYLTDFYLVDLRGAKYDASQEAHFRKCKAILDDWNDGL